MNEGESRCSESRNFSLRLVLRRGGGGGRKGGMTVPGGIRYFAWMEGKETRSREEGVQAVGALLRGRSSPSST